MVAEAAVAAFLPPIITVVQSGIHKVYDERTRRGLTKLNEVFLNAQMGEEFTKKDFQRAKHYYAKIEAVALISQNQLMLDSIKEGLAFLKTTLLVKNLLEKNHETDPSDSMGNDRKRPAFDVLKEGGVTIEKGETQSLRVTESLWIPPFLSKTRHASTLMADWPSSTCH